MDERIKTFDEFWPFYVRQHLHPANRALHFLGTSAVLGIATLALVRRKPAWLLAAPVVGYGPAWIGHFLIEKNRPATFTYPVWSLLADFKMWGKIVTRSMAEEVRRAQEADRVSSPASSASTSSHEPLSNGVSHANVSLRCTLLPTFSVKATG